MRLFYTFTFILLSAAIFGSQIYRDDSVLFCLNPSEDLLTISNERGIVTTDNPALNSLLRDVDAAGLERWIPFATEEDHKGDIYLNRIYRLRLDENSRLDYQTVRADLQQYDFVHSAELEPIHKPLYTPNDFYYNQQWFLSNINANDAWDFWDVNDGDIPGDRDIILASIDTGVDWDHNDLVNNLWQNLNEDADGDGHTIEWTGSSWILDSGDLNGIDDDDWDNSPDTFIDDLIGWDLSGWDGMDDNNPIPKQGVSNYGTWAHGTHVAGLLSATTDNSTGIASTAFNCSIMSVKVSTESQTGQPYITDGYSGILYAAKAGYNAQGFAILNNSWGGLGYNQYEQTVIDIAHDNYHAVVVAAAGNGNDNGWGEIEQTHYPSSYENVISVCPTGNGNAWNHWATYHETVDIASPGEGIRSCVINNNYDSWAGSSMASPIVASAIGLLKANYPQMNNIQLETMILATADPILYQVNQEGYLQGKLGSGRVDVLKALEVGVFPSIQFIGEDINILDDSDGEINPGEDIELRAILLNDEAWGVAWGISGELTCDVPGVTIVDGSSDFWDMEPGDASLNEEDPFIVSFGNAVPDGEVVFNLHISSNEYDWVIYETDLELVLQVEASLLYGDANGDAVLDVLDVLTMVSIIMGTIEPTDYMLAASDMNGDTVVDVFDIILLVQVILGN